MTIERWLFPQNASNINQFFTTIEYFERLNGKVRDGNLQIGLMRLQKEYDGYRPYKEGNFDISSANHKIDEPRFYGAIYETTNKKIHLSSYGELLFKYFDGNIEKRNKIFIAMLLNLQFPHPGKNKISDEFKLYPFRLIFNLLLEEELGYDLSIIEISHILYYIKEVKDEVNYLDIMNKIIEFRRLNIETKIENIGKDINGFIINYINCNYFINILKNLEIVEINPEEFTVLQSTMRKDPTTIKNITLKLKKDSYSNFIRGYLKIYPVYEKVRPKEGFINDWITNVYNSIPEYVLNEISENDVIYTKYLQIPKLILETSTDSERWKEFEEALKEGFNLFDDVKAETISGSGETDVICTFNGEYNFCVEAKSTKNKLKGINAGRLNIHRKKTNALYTLVVTPAYTFSAVSDIEDSKVCIITSYCFSDLITKYLFKRSKNHIDHSYEPFHNLILKNLGKDISLDIYKMIDDATGVDSEIFKKKL